MTTSVPITFNPRSDDLSGLRHVLEAFPQFAAHLPRPLSLRVVFDANVVIAEVRWLVKNRRQADARPALLEAIAAGTVVAFAPSFLRTEVEKELATVSRDEGIPLDRLLAEWEGYASHLRFVDACPLATATTGEIVDPKDVPYLHVCDRLGAQVILTDDAHLARMGGTTARPLELSIALRTYARATAVELTIKLNGVVLATLALEALAAALRLVRSAVTLFRRLPPEMQLLIAGLVVAALLHEPTRGRLKEKLMSALHALGRAAEAVAPVYGQLAEQSKRAHQEAAEAWQLVASKVPAKRVALRAHVLALCADGKGSLSEEQLSRRLALLGGSHISKEFSSKPAACVAEPLGVDGSLAAYVG